MLQRRNLVSCALCAAIGLEASIGHANAAGTSGLTRTILQKTELPGDKYVCILATVEIEPNVLVPRHTHPGVESSILLSGSVALSVQGQPDRTIKAGDGFQVAPEVPHSARTGPETARIAITYIVEKDKPLASPAPE
jgi:quercetin dioxygenase-like cupin family protein